MIGKSHLTHHFLGLALDLPWLACGRFELKGCAGLEGEFGGFVRNLGVDEVVCTTRGQPLSKRLEAVFDELSRRGEPTLLLFDAFEQGGKWSQWVEQHALLTVPRAPWLRLVIAGQTVPDRTKAAWARYAAPVIRLRQPEWQDWLEFAKRHGEDVTPEDIQTAYRLSRGRPSLLAQLLGSSV